MEYIHDPDPLISSTMYPGLLAFDPYSRPKVILDDAHDIHMHLDSPDSMETYSDELAFQDSASVASAEDTNDSLASNPDRLVSSPNDDGIEADRLLVNERFAPYNTFPADNTWTLEERIERLLELSPCRKYTRTDLLNIDSVDSAERKVDMLIELVSKVHVNHRWNYVQPHELHHAYTVVANCKKEKKRGADGQMCPKRPMNAFMIWSMKCRALIAQITPQLHNAIISTKLGAAWRKCDPEVKALYEREKEVLGAFHRFEFPGYKYRPKKKPRKLEESEPKQQSKCLKRKRPEARQAAPSPSPLSPSDARQNLNPALKERLIVKMQVKIDPLLKKGIGKRVTAVGLADLHAFQQSSIRSMTSAEKQLSPSALELSVDGRPSSVYDTPENSPLKPSPASSPEPISQEQEDMDVRGDGCFDLDEKPSLVCTVDDMDSNDPVIRTHIKSEPVIKSEPALQWRLNSDVKPDPLGYQAVYPDHAATIKSEPQPVLVEGHMPVLTVEAVDSVLDTDCPSNYHSQDMLEDFMKYLDTDMCFSSDLLPGDATSEPGSPASI